MQQLIFITRKNKPITNETILNQYNYMDECMDLYGVFVDIDEEVVVSFYITLNQQIKSSVSVGKITTYKFNNYTYTTQ